MNLTLAELKERMTEHLTEFDILEALNITTSDLVEAFEDRIQEKYEFLMQEIPQLDTNNEQEPEEA